MKFNRRSLLRGSCQGALAVMGLPFLDCFLNHKGQAQTNGRALPTRFNTFFWGCGLTASLWIPKTAGTGYEMTVQLKPLEPYRKKLNVFSGLRVPLDSKPNGQHWPGLAAAITGIAPSRQGASGQWRRPQAATPGRAIPASAGPIISHRNPHRCRSTRAFSAPDFRIRQRATGSPIRES